MIRTTRTRRGVTLVELLVASAMLMLGMWLMVWLYQQAMANFIGTKAQADLTTQQRTVVMVISRDLGSRFFLDEDAKPNRGRRLSDQWAQTVGPNGTVSWAQLSPPRGGYFSALSTPYGNSLFVNPNGVYEATDSDGFVSGRSTNHFLQFTIILSGGPDYQLIGAEIPVGTGNQFFGTAAEITYALVPNGLSTAGGYVLYDLIRRQRLTALSTDDTPSYQAAIAPYLGTDNVSEVTTFTGNTVGSTMLNMSNLTVPANRLQSSLWPLNPVTSKRYGEERLMTNVLSFEVKFSGTPTVLGTTLAPSGYGVWPSDPYSNAWPRPLVGNSTPSGTGANNTDYPYDFLPFNSQFDTYTTQLGNWQTLTASTAAPTNPIKPIRVTNIMIRIRSYDIKNQTTRQTTITSPL
jgi:hypothetical protein